MQLPPIHGPLIAVAALLLSPAALVAQGSLTPPGPPEPTMKSLDQLEPRIAVNAVNTPGDADFEYIIDLPGSYYLTSNLEIAQPNGVLICSPDVTLDLNGFEISRVAGETGDGVRIDLSAHRCTVRNGSITGFENGLHVFQPDDELPENTARGGRFSGIHASDCTKNGIFGGEDWTIDGCIARSNGQYGITSWEGAVVTDCVASGNGWSGFHLRGTAVARSCVASSNGQSGIVAGRRSRIDGCTASSNGENGIRAGRDSVVTHCATSANVSSGISASGGSAISHCTAFGNTGSAGITLSSNCTAIENTCFNNATGIRVNGLKCRVEGNHISENATGIDVNSSRNLIIGNFAAGNSTADYAIAAGNRYGPLIDIRASGTAAVSGNAANDTTTTIHPWANFSY